MDPYLIPFALRDAVLCLVFLLGAGAGIFAVTRKRSRVGAFTIAGFLLLGIDPVVEFLIFNILPMFGANPDYTILNWSYACISGFADVSGALALMAALYFAIQPAPKNADGAGEEIVYSAKE